MGRPAGPPVRLLARPADWLLAAGIILVPVLLHLVLLQAQVDYVSDDEMAYLWGTRVHRFADLSRLVTSDIYKVWQQSHYTYDAYAAVSDYRPVSYLFMAALHPLFDLRPLGYRVINLLVYSLGTLLVLLVLYRLTQDALLTWLAAGLFAVDASRMAHAWMMVYQGGLYVVLYLASVLGYLAARTVQETPRRRQAYGLSLLAALGACFTHELACSLPFVLLWIEWFGGVVRRRWPFRPLWVLPHGLLALFYVGMRTMVESGFPPDVTRLRFTNPHDLLYATIHMTSRIMMLFIPGFAVLRRNAKEWAFGDAPGQATLSAHPLLEALAAGLLVAAGVGLLWLLTRPRVQRSFWEDTRGQWALCGGGWCLLALGPTAIVNGAMLHHLPLAAIGANLLKALVLVATGDWIGRQWGWDRRWLAAGLAVPVILYSVNSTAQASRAGERDVSIRRGLVADAIRHVREAAVEGPPLLVYYFDGAGGASIGIGLQEHVQVALGREDIRVVMPYTITALRDDARLDPAVMICPDRILVVNTGDPLQLIIGLAHYDPAVVRPGLRVRNGDLYTVEVVEADDVRHSLQRFVIYYTRPAGMRLLFLRLAGNRLIRQDMVRCDDVPPHGGT